MPVFTLSVFMAFLVVTGPGNFTGTWSVLFEEGLQLGTTLRTGELALYLGYTLLTPGCPVIVVENRLA